MKRNQQNLEFLCFKEEQGPSDPILSPLRKSESHLNRFVPASAENTADKNENEV